MKVTFKNPVDRDIVELMTLLFCSETKWTEVATSKYRTAISRLQTLGYIIVMSRYQMNRPSRSPGVCLTDSGRKFAALCMHLEA